MTMKEIEISGLTLAIALKVELARRTRGWTLAELASKTGSPGEMSEGQITRLEAGERRIDIEDVHGLARAFGIPAIVLFAGSQSDVLHAIADALDGKQVR